MSIILPKDSSKVSYSLKITVSKQFDNFAKRALRVTETGTSRIKKDLTTKTSDISIWLLVFSKIATSLKMYHENHLVHQAHLHICRQTPQNSLQKGETKFGFPAKNRCTLKILSYRVILLTEV